MKFKLISLLLYFKCGLVVFMARNPSQWFRRRRNYLRVNCDLKELPPTLYLDILHGWFNLTIRNALLTISSFYSQNISPNIQHSWFTLTFHLTDLTWQSLWLIYHDIVMWLIYLTFHIFILYWGEQLANWLVVRTFSLVVNRYALWSVDWAITPHSLPIGYYNYLRHIQLCGYNGYNTLGIISYSNV